MGSIKCVCRLRDAISAVEYEVAQCDEYLKMEKFRFVGLVVEPAHLSSSFYPPYQHYSDKIGIFDYNRLI